MSCLLEAKHLFISGKTMLLLHEGVHDDTRHSLVLASASPYPSYGSRPAVPSIRPIQSRPPPSYSVTRDSKVCFPEGKKGRRKKGEGGSFDFSTPSSPDEGDSLYITFPPPQTQLAQYKDWERERMESEEEPRQFCRFSRDSYSAPSRVDLHPFLVAIALTNTLLVLLFVSLRVQ